MVDAALATCRAVLAAAVALAQAVPAGPVTEAEMVRRVLAGDLAQARGAVAAASRRAAEAWRIAEPAWTLGTLREESLGRHAPYSAQVSGVAVEWELGSRNRWARQAGDARALEARDRLEADLLALACDVRELALLASQARARADLLEASARRVEEHEAALSRLVEAGEHSEHDLRRLRGEVAIRAGEAALAGSAAGGVATELSALAGATMAATPVEADAPVPGADELVALALASDPRVRALGRAVEAARADVELARRSHPARLEVRGAHRRDDEPGIPPGDGYEAEVAVTLPSTGLRRSEIARANADLLMAEAELRGAELGAERRLRALHARLAALQGTPGPVVGDADALVEGARRRFDAGEGTMTETLDVLDAAGRSALLQLELDGQRRHARLEIDCATGLATAPDLRAVLEERLP